MAIAIRDEISLVLSGHGMLHYNMPRHSSRRNRVYVTGPNTASMRRYAGFLTDAGFTVRDIKPYSHSKLVAIEVSRSK